MMDLIERYLGAVRWNLPADKADDIVAELRDLIAARIEDREEALGRPLTDAELSTLLREFGHPLSVAGAYHGQRALIGPELFPFYWFVLKVVLAVRLVVAAIEMAGRLIVGHGHFMQLVGQGIGDTFDALLTSAAFVTLGFAIIERTGMLAGYLDKWQPEELPDLSALRLPRGTGLRRHPGWEPLFETVALLVFLGWWTGLLPFDWPPRHGELAIEATAVWAALYWPVVALIVLRIAQGVVTLLRPAWKPLRAALILGGAAGTIVIAAVLYHAGRLLTVVPLMASAAHAAELQQVLDRALPIAVLVAGAITLVQAATELWKLAGERR
jgi:hypothetical protein